MNNKSIYEYVLDGNLVIVKRTIKHIFSRNNYFYEIIGRVMIDNFESIKIKSFGRIIKRIDGFAVEIYYCDKITFSYNESVLIKLAKLLNKLNNGNIVLNDLWCKE
jgi:hypothetical protein